MEKELKTKIALLYGTKAEWESEPLKSRVLKKGEVCICSFTNGNTGIKVGNGVDVFADLQWIKADHGDVMIYAGATEAKPQNLTGLSRISGLIKQDIIDDNMAITLEIPIVLRPGERGKYPVFAIDKRFKLLKWTPPDHDDWLFEYATLEKDNYTLYYFNTRSTASVSSKFTLKLGGQE